MERKEEKTNVTSPLHVQNVMFPVQNYDDDDHSNSMLTVFIERRIHIWHRKHIMDKKLNFVENIWQLGALCCRFSLLT